MTKEEKSEVFSAILEYLNTNDKRKMFLRCTFKDLLPNFYFRENDDDPIMSALSIYNVFVEKRMLGSLTAAMNSVFDLELTVSL